MARRELAAIVKRNPRSRRAIYYQAVERMAAADYPGAQAFARRGLAIEPNDLQFLMLLGAAAASEKNYAEAEKTFRRVIEIEPRALPAYDNLGQTLWLMGRQDEAKAVYRQRRCSSKACRSGRKRRRRAGLRALRPPPVMTPPRDPLEEVLRELARLAAEEAGRHAQGHLLRAAGGQLELKLTLPLVPGDDLGPHAARLRETCARRSRRS